MQSYDFWAVLAHSHIDDMPTSKLINHWEQQQLLFVRQ